MTALRSQGGGRDRKEDELEVRDRRRVLDPLVVHERVAGDRRPDDEREHDAARVHRPAQAAHEDDSRADRDDAESLPRAESGAGGGRPDQHEHGRSPARDGIHETDVRAAIRGDEQEEVRRLERRRRRDPGDRGRLDLPGERRDGREQHDRGDERDGGRRADVARAAARRTFHVACSPAAPSARASAEAGI